MLIAQDVRRYAARRRAGGIRYGIDEDGNPRVSRAVRQRAVQADVKLLKQLLYWACATVDEHGRVLLERNPLADVEIKGETDVQRPVASHNRFLATRAAMQRLQQRYLNEAAAEESPKA